MRTEGSLGALHLFASSFFLPLLSVHLVFLHFKFSHVPPICLARVPYSSLSFGDSQSHFSIPLFSNTPRSPLSLLFYVPVILVVFLFLATMDQTSHFHHYTNHTLRSLS